MSKHLLIDYDVSFSLFSLDSFQSLLLMMKEKKLAMRFSCSLRSYFCLIRFLLSEMKMRFYIVYCGQLIWSDG